MKTNKEWGEDFLRYEDIKNTRHCISKLSDDSGITGRVADISSDVLGYTRAVAREIIGSLKVN